MISLAMPDRHNEDIRDYGPSDVRHHRAVMTVKPLSYVLRLDTFQIASGKERFHRLLDLVVSDLRSLRQRFELAACVPLIQRRYKRTLRVCFTFLLRPK